MTNSFRTRISFLAIIMCLFAIIFYCYEYYLRVMPSVMGPELRSAFKMNETMFGYLAAFYYYAYTPMQVPVGLLIDRYGPRRILTFACLCCAVGTLWFASTTSIWIAQWCRFLLGFGSAFAYVGVLKISADWLPKQLFAFMAGLATALGMFGAISGELVMRQLVDNLGWQTSLIYSGFAGVILTVLLWILLRDRAEPLVKNTKTMSKTPYRSIFLNKQLWLVGVIGCLTFLPISGFAEIWAVSFLESTGMSAGHAAMGSSCLFLGFACGGPLWGIISDLIQSRKIPLIIGSFCSAVLLAIALYYPSHSIYWMGSLFFFSAFFASAEVLVFAVGNDSAEPGLNGTTASFINMMTMIGGALIPPMIGRLLDASIQMTEGRAVIALEAFSKSLIVLPLSLLVAGALSLFLTESYERNENE